jgi:hypothetical protein
MLGSARFRATSVPYTARKWIFSSSGRSFPGNCLGSEESFLALSKPKFSRSSCATAAYR